MKKKNIFNCLLLCLIVTFSFMNDVFADGLDFTTEAKLSNSGDIYVDDTISINVSLKSEEAISSCTFKVESEGGLVFDSKNALNNYIFESNELSELKIKYNSSDTLNLKEGKTVLKLNYKVTSTDESKITVTTSECINVDGTKSGSYQAVEVLMTAKSKSEDTSLSNIEVTGGTISNFKVDNLTPSIKLDKTNFSLKLTASNPDYQDSIIVQDSDGNKLDPSNLIFSDSTGQGIMKIDVIVGNDKYKTTYNLGISYEAKELDNSLSKLTINGVNVNLVKGQTDYTVKIDSSATSIVVDATLTDSQNFRFADGNGPSTYNITSKSIALIIEPTSSESGGVGVTYIISIEGNNNSSSSSTFSSSSSSNANSNPQTGNISMFIMAIILIASFVGSTYLYKKNIEGYK